jgi:hypothetical protein
MNCRMPSPGYGRPKRACGVTGPLLPWLRPRHGLNRSPRQQPLLRTKKPQWIGSMTYFPNTLSGLPRRLERFTEKGEWVARGAANSTAAWARSCWVDSSSQRSLRCCWFRSSWGSALGCFPQGLNRSLSHPPSMPGPQLPSTCEPFNPAATQEGAPHVLPSII